MTKMKLSLTTGTIALALLLGASACKKESSTASLHDRFVGTWKLHLVTVDANGNGTQDAADTSVVWDDFNARIIFNSNGSGTSSSILGAGTPFTWTLSSDNKYLLSTDSGTTAAYGNYIITEPGNTFVVKDTANGTLQWETFNKQ